MILSTVYLHSRKSILQHFARYDKITISAVSYLVTCLYSIISQFTKREREKGGENYVRSSKLPNRGIRIRRFLSHQQEEKSVLLRECEKRTRLTIKVGVHPAMAVMLVGPTIKSVELEYAAALRIVEAKKVFFSKTGAKMRRLSVKVGTHPRESDHTIRVEGRDSWLLTAVISDDNVRGEK